MELGVEAASMSALIFVAAVRAPELGMLYALMAHGVHKIDCRAPRHGSEGGPPCDAPFQWLMALDITDRVLSIHRVRDLAKRD